MAYIPDSAMDRAYIDLSIGARDLYVFLARCRNQKTGKCCPSISTIISHTKHSRPRIFAYKKELREKGWAVFDGDKALELYGFGSLENETVYERSERLSVVPASDSRLENETPIRRNDKSNDNNIGSLKNETTDRSRKNKIPATSLRIETRKSQNRDSKVSELRLAYKEEPAKEPAKEPCTASPSASRQSDPFFEKFKTAYESVYGCPYQYKQADFVQLAKTKKQINPSLTDWQRAVDHYLASEIATHTLADLAVRFGTFYRSALDRFNKPVLNGATATEKPKREYTGLTWATMTEEQRASFRN